MLKSDLIKQLSEAFPGNTQKELHGVVDRIFDLMIDTFANGGRVEVRGFGALAVKERNARPGRNPKTGEAVEVSAKRVVAFRAGKELRDRVKNR